MKRDHLPHRVETLNIENKLDLAIILRSSTTISDDARTDNP